MKVNRLALINFRNYKKQVFDFYDHINLIIGKNAQGKTNLIEALYLLSLSKSFRTRIHKEMIFFDENFTKIVGIITTKQRKKELQLVLSDDGKRAKIDGNDILKTSEFVGVLNVVVFTPDDLSLVKGSPSLRRKFMDIELSKINKYYLSSYNQYHKLLKERNLYLKQLQIKNKFTNDTYLDVLSEQMAALQVKLIKERKVFLDKLNYYASSIYQQISNSKEFLTIEYACFYDENDEKLYDNILRKYQKNVEKDIRYAKTSDGIHKDDFTMKLNQKDALLYASQGQQRSIVLSLKIGLVSLIYEIINEYPVLLLDDVLSELDIHRQNQLLNLINQDIQTFITSTSLDHIKHEVLLKAKRFYIKEGGQIDG